MRIAVIGAGGQLGRDLLPLLPGEVVPLDRSRLDLRHADAMRATLTALAPTCVVNCAAYNFVDRAEAEPETAFAVNAFGVRALALACRDLECTLVHFSTDHVFGLDTARARPYRETDAAGPVSVYGVGKLAGEAFVRAVCPRHFVVRTCGLYGRHGSGGKGTNFVETMLKKAAAGQPLRVVDDQRCTPTATTDLAQAVAALLTTEAYGLYHLTNAGDCSWYEFARQIFDHEKLAVDLQPTTSAAFAAAARRPSYSVLDSGKYAALGLTSLCHWREPLARYLDARRA